MIYLVFNLYRSLSICQLTISLLHNQYLGINDDVLSQYCNQVVGGGKYGDACYSSTDQNLNDTLNVLHTYAGKQLRTVKEHIGAMLDALEQLHFVDNLHTVMEYYQDSDVLQYKTLNQTQGKLERIVEELTRY